MSDNGIIKTHKTIRIFGARAKLTLSCNDDWFFADSAIYNHSLARLCSVLAYAGYSLPAMNQCSACCGAYTALEGIGMDGFDCHSETGSGEVDYCLAKKELKDGFTLILCCSDGSRYGQWYSNFDSGTGEVHKGFDSARNFVLKGLREYCAANAVKKEKLKLLFTGHSRGGATANLLAAGLIESEELALKENIFAYTFAAPNPVKAAAAKGEEYNRIFNFVNTEDFVTRCMPREWGYTRFGKTLALPGTFSKENAGMLCRVRNYYADFCGGKKYLGFPNGSKSVDSLFSSLTKSVKTVEDYYGLKFNSFADKLSVHDFFEKSLCAVVGTAAGSAENTAGTKLLIKTSLARPCSNSVFKKIADFFVFYEGLGGATNGKISAAYFSFAHDMSTYCAFLHAAESDDLKEI